MQTADPAVPSEDEQDELLVARWDSSRSGARAGRGFHFQDAVGALLASRIVTGSLVGALVPEGFDDMTIEGDRCVNVQVKSRSNHLGPFSVAGASRHVLDAWRKNGLGSDSETRLVVFLERGVRDQGALDDFEQPLSRMLDEGSSLLQAIRHTAKRDGLSVRQVDDLLASTSVVGMAWGDVVANTSDELSVVCQIPPVGLHVVGQSLRLLVADASDTNAAAGLAERRVLSLDPPIA